MQHAGWVDDLLVGPMRACAPAVAGGKLFYARNAGDVYTDASSNRRVVPDKARADLTLGLRDMVLARGEDKVGAVSHDTAIAQLARKFFGAYNSRLYGPQVRFDLTLHAATGPVGTPLLLSIPSCAWQ